MPAKNAKTRKRNLVDDDDDGDDTSDYDEPPKKTSKKKSMTIKKAVVVVGPATNPRQVKKRKKSSHSSTKSDDSADMAPPPFPFTVDAATKTVDFPSPTAFDASHSSTAGAPTTRLLHEPQPTQPTGQPTPPLPSTPISERATRGTKVHTGTASHSQIVPLPTPATTATATPGTPVKKKTMRVATSPTKRRSEAPPTSATSETLFVLGGSTNMWGTELETVDARGNIAVLKIWKKSDKNQFKVSMGMTFIEVDKLAGVTISKYGSQRTVTNKTTATEASTANHFNVGATLWPLLRKPDHNVNIGAPFLVYAELKTAEIETVLGTKAPNFRGTIQSSGVAADVFGWMPDHVLDKVSVGTGPTKKCYVLAEAVRQQNRMDTKYYDLRLSSNAVVGDEAFFRGHLPSLHEHFERNLDLPGLPRDDCYPRTTVYDALRKIGTDPENSTIFVKAKIEIEEAGSNLTVPICSEPDCPLQCGYESDTGPFTCNDHGIVDPHVVSRPTATINVRTQDNHHNHTDKDLALTCTIAKNQEEVYLGMTLDSLQEDDIDVDAIRDGLKGQRFNCTLIISQNSITAIRLRKDYATPSQP
jgi:hypothetical protein